MYEMIALELIEFTIIFWCFSLFPSCCIIRVVLHLVGIWVIQKIVNMFSVDILCEINNTWSLIQIDLVMVNANCKFQGFFLSCCWRSILGLVYYSRIINFSYFCETFWFTKNCRAYSASSYIPRTTTGKEYTISCIDK